MNARSEDKEKGYLAFFSVPLFVGVKKLGSYNVGGWLWITAAPNGLHALFTRNARWTRYNLGGKKAQKTYNGWNSALKKKKGSKSPRTLQTRQKTIQNSPDPPFRRSFCPCPFSTAFF